MTNVFHPAMNTTNFPRVSLVQSWTNRVGQSCLWLAGLLDNHLYLPFADVAVVLAGEAGEGGKHVVGRAQRLAQLVTDKGM